MENDIKVISRSNRRIYNRLNGSKFIEMAIIEYDNAVYKLGILNLGTISKYEAEFIKFTNNYLDYIKLHSIILFENIIYEMVYYNNEETTYTCNKIFNVYNKKQYKNFYIINDGNCREYFKSIDGIAYQECTKNKLVLEVYPLGKPNKIFYLPDNVRYINYHTFNNNYNLETIVINNSVHIMYNPKKLINTSLKNIIYKNKLIKLIDEKWKIK